MPKKKVKKVEAIGEIIRMQEGFFSRFNLLNQKSDRKQFHNRCVTSVGIFFTWLYQSQIDLITLNVSKLLGVHINIKPDISEKDSQGFYYEKSRLYKLLNAFDLSKESLLFTWLMVIEVLANASCEGDDQINARKSFVRNLAEALELSGINAILCDTPDGYKFYPANSELLDIKLVIDVLNWLSDYPKAKEKYDSALRLFLKGDRTRHVLDDCRLSLELFVKQYLGSPSSLENQVAELGRFLKGKSVSSELRNMFNSILKGYTDFNNRNVNHDDIVNGNEIEFVIYLTGAFMRLLITSAKN